MHTTDTPAAKHTPGPWKANVIRPENGRHEIYAGNQIVAQAFNWMLDATGADYAEADARLIAAAPDLLQALKALHDKTAELIAHLQATNRLRPCFNLPALDEAAAILRRAA